MSRYTSVSSIVNRVAVGAAALSLFAGAAHGSYIGTLEMNYVGTGLGQSVRIDVGGSVKTVFAGEIRFETRNGVDAGAQFDAITMPTFCVEPTQTVQSGWRTYEVTVPETSAAPLMDLARAVALNNASAYFYSQRAAGAIDSAAAAGFQVALWEIMRDYDGNAGRSSLDITGGDFKATQSNGTALATSVTNWVGQFLDAASASSFDGQTSYVLHSATSQDQIIPGPGGMSLAYMSLLLCAGRRRRV